MRALYKHIFVLPVIACFVNGYASIGYIDVGGANDLVCFPDQEYSNGKDSEDRIAVWPEVYPHDFIDNDAIPYETVYKIRDEGLLEAWKKAFTRNLPDSWRKNPDFLKPFAKALEEKPKIDLHLTGYINSSENAVGCHLASAIDNVKVRLKNSQPTGLPTYYPDGTLKKAAVEIKDESGNWIAKNANSTFFSKGWTNDKVLKEIAYVRSQTANQISDRKWRGLASNGVTEIEVRYAGPLDDLTFDTAFPIL